MAKPKINSQFLQSLATSYSTSLQGKDCADIITFTKADWGLNFNLSPVQEFILTLFYGLPLDDTTKSIVVPDDINSKKLGVFTQREFLDFLIQEGRINLKEYKEGHKFNELILCLGRRSGKSVLSSIICNYEVYRLVKMGNPQSYFNFPDGQQISVTSVATTDEQAQTMFDMVRTRGGSCAYLKDRINSSTQTYFDIYTDDDREKKRAKGSIKLQCGGSSSAALRGSNNIVVIFDEAAFFLSGAGRNSGEEIYKALTPSILTFQGEGKILLLSSPNSKTGLFYNKYKESFENPDRILMLQLYTSLTNPRGADVGFLKAEKKRDKKSFDCEFGANFSDTLTSWIDETEVFDKCINKDKDFQKKGVQGVEYYWGIDLGLKNDGTAITICHRENDKVIIDYSNVWYSGSSDVWDSGYTLYSRLATRELAGYEILPVSEIVELIKRLSMDFPIADGWFDQFNGQALHEMLLGAGVSKIKMVSVTSGINTQTYQIAKNLYTAGLLEIPNSELLLTELKTLEETRTGNVVCVQAPQRQGFHDDIATSFVRAVSSCYNSKLKRKTEAVTLSAGLNNGNISKAYQQKMFGAGNLNSNISGNRFDSYTRRFR